MQPQNSNSPASLSDPTNVYMNDLGPGQSATPTEDVTSSTGKKATVGQIGKSGTYIFNGIITREEYNPEMMRWELLKNIDIMRRSDATIQALLDVIKLPILSATWTIEAASDDPQDIEIADFVRYCLFENNIVFSDLLSEVLTYQDFGYSVFEKVWDYIDWQPNPVTPPKPEPPKAEADENGNFKPIEPVPDPEPIEQPIKHMLGLVDLQSRKQRSIYRWQTNDQTPTFGITQYVPGGTYSVPGEKLCIFTRKKEGENYEGQSLLRASYKHWKIKDALELIEAIRHERQGLGVLEVIPPEGANEDDINDAIENARQARASEEGVIKHPAGWTIEWMDMKAGSAQLTDIGATLEYHKREILKSGLAQFLELGGNKGGSGSKATSVDQSSLFNNAEEFTAKYVGHVFNRSIIKELVDLNYSKVKHYPTLEHSKIGDDNLTEIGTVVNQLITAGAITPDPQFEQWLRAMLHAPDLPDDMAENYDDLAARQKQPTIMQVPGMPGAPAAPADPGNTEAAPEDDDAATSTEQTTTANDALEEARKAKARLIDIVVR